MLTLADAIEALTGQRIAQAEQPLSSVVVDSRLVTPGGMFIALHGDSEYAMKTFSLQAGLLITCQYMLRDRLRVQQPEQPELE